MGIMWTLIDSVTCYVSKLILSGFVWVWHRMLTSINYATCPIYPDVTRKIHPVAIICQESTLFPGHSSCPATGFPDVLRNDPLSCWWTIWPCMDEWKREISWLQCHESLSHGSPTPLHYTHTFNHQVISHQLVLPNLVMCLKRRWMHIYIIIILIWLEKHLFSYRKHWGNRCCYQCGGPPGLINQNATQVKPFVVKVCL